MNSNIVITYVVVCCATCKMYPLSLPSFCFDASNTCWDNELIQQSL